VSLLVSIVYTSILILQTPLPISTTLLVIRVLHLMTQVCSIAHTFLSRWFVPLVRTPSNPRLASRPVMVLLLTHLQKVEVKRLKVLVVSRPIATVTTEESVFKTSCDHGSHIFSGGSSDPLFL
jgi:hypothetical protein